ncbi:Senescence marker protein-30 [Klebsiella pneumoniae]|nr:Senescence marker protein-30 [Klebsiella pneumoniae]
MRIEVLLDLKTRLGESPVWDVEQQRLWWVDSLDGRLFACNAQGGAIKSWDVRQKIGSFALRPERRRRGGGAAEWRSSARLRQRRADAVAPSGSGPTL